MKRLLSVCATGGLALLWATSVWACVWQLNGQIHCEGNGLPLAGVQIRVQSSDGGGFDGTAISDETGYYSVLLPEVPGCYRATAVLGPSESVVLPSGGVFDFCLTAPESPTTQNWVIASPSCTGGTCWLTAGGAKFNPITGSKLGENGPRFSWGGNVNPGCSPTAGEGGQWNTIAHHLKLHFQGWQIEVVRCGNVDGIPPGSDSPQTPYNFIEFRGTGTLKGIRGNKVDFGTVYFWARCEDRNEPGSAGERDGASKDRYFLHVFADPAAPNASTLLLVDEDGDPATVDPLTITDGNMQIHISSCESVIERTTPAALSLPPAAAPGAPVAGTEVAQLSFAAAGTNPIRDAAMLRFTLPQDAAVSLSVFDVTGRLVRELAEGRHGAGVHTVGWDLRDAEGQKIARGVYFARLVVGARKLTRTLVVVR
jgi:hypothetical protein